MDSLFIAGLGLLYFYGLNWDNVPVDRKWTVHTAALLITLWALSSMNFWGVL